MYLATERDGLCFSPFNLPPNPLLLLLLLLTPTPSPPPTGPPLPLIGPPLPPTGPPKHKVTKLLRTFNYSATSHLTSHKSQVAQYSTLLQLYTTPLYYLPSRPSCAYLRHLHLELQ